jgi:negative regulator of flagellin synthesis FlgM
LVHVEQVATTGTRQENLMKIGNSADKPATAPAPSAASIAATQAATGTAGVAAVSSVQPVEASAKVALSSTATELRASVAGVTGGFDAAKVARISQAIERGEFKVDAGAIADKLIANAAELLNNVPPKKS